jgi:ABC-type branched-subunit amino acid transport system substrate-binding protein
MGAFIDWVTGDWAKKTGQKVKLAILTWDSTYGRAIMVDETRNYAKSKGVEIVYEGVYGMRDLDVSTQMTAIKAAGANWVYDNTLAHGPKVVSGAAAALDMLNKNLYDTTPGKIHRATGPWGTDESAVMLLGDLAEGMVGPRSFASWSMPEVEGIAAAIAAADKHNRAPKERVMGYLAAWSEVYTICYGMNKAVKEAGWENLNGETLRAQFLKLKGFSPQGMTKYTFTADKPEPTQTRILQVQGGKLLPISDWVTCPDLRPAQ